MNKCICYPIYFIPIFIKSLISFFILLYPSVIEIYNLDASLDSYVLTDFGLRDSTESYNILGPFHKWGGSEEEICTKVYEGVCIESSLQKYDAVNISKISNKYATGKIYKKYIDLLKNGNIISSKDSCEKNLKNCGKIDTLGQQLCLPINIKCPIQDLRVGNKRYSGYDNILYEYKDKVSEYVSYTNGNTESTIIGNISLSFGPPCINTNEESWVKIGQREKDETIKCKREMNGIKTDLRYHSAGNISVINIYQSNLQEKAFNSIYNDIIGHYLGIYIRPFIGININCLNDSKFDYDKFKSMIEAVNYIYRFTKAYCVLTPFFFIIIILIAKGKIHDFIQAWILVFVVFFNSFLILNHYACLDFLTDAIHDCSDEFTNTLYKDDFSRIFIMLLLMWIFFLCDIALFILPICLNCETYEKTMKKCCDKLDGLCQKKQDDNEDDSSDEKNKENKEEDNDEKLLIN